jgi:hypothetical protein
MYAGTPLLPEMLMLVGVLIVIVAVTMAWRRKRRWGNGTRPGDAVRPPDANTPPRRRPTEVNQRRDAGGERGNKGYGERESRGRRIRKTDEGHWETQRGKNGGDGAGTKA